MNVCVSNNKVFVSNDHIMHSTWNDNMRKKKKNQSHIKGPAAVHASLLIHQMWINVRLKLQSFFPI